MLISFELLIVVLEEVGLVLSEEQKKLLVELWNRGARLEDIARSVGIPAKKVSLYARFLGLPPRRRDPWNKRIGDEELKQIIDLWKAGTPVKEIARRLGVTETTILTYLNVMGLRRRERLYGKVEEVMKMLETKCYITSKELARMKIKLPRRKFLEALSKRVENVVVFKIRQTSTTKYTVLRPRLARSLIIYLRGCENGVARFIVDNIVNKNAPLASIKSILKRSGAPPELLQAVYNLILQTSPKYSNKSRTGQTQQTQ
jgi:DNA-binding transcriptional MerR regulator